MRHVQGPRLHGHGAPWASGAPCEEEQSTLRQGPAEEGMGCMGKPSTGPGAQHVRNQCQLLTPAPASPSGTEKATFLPSLGGRALGQAAWGSARHLFGPRTDHRIVSLGGFY